MEDESEKSLRTPVTCYSNLEIARHQKNCVPENGPVWTDTRARLFIKADQNGKER